MLSAEEQRVWDDVQRFWTEEIEEPPRATPSARSRRERPSREPADPPVAVVVGARITIVLILLGVLAPGLAIGVATALGWALWRVWPQLSGRGAPGTPPDGGADGTSRRPADQPGHGRPPGRWIAD
ncbi:hypothetical protein ACI782_19120 [Geodermatophilus sp. SYSU D00703]